MLHIEKKSTKYTYVIGFLNDLWRYRVSDNTWTLIHGSNAFDQKGVYGEKGQASESNIPGARNLGIGWYDPFNHEFWIFGGRGYDYQENGM